MAEVACGWVIIDQAAVIKGMSFGPDYIKGRQRTGPLRPGYHNLIGKDVVFRAEGKDALVETLQLMSQMDKHFIRCGIREGMTIERFLPSEYGGGDDQVTDVAGPNDIVRMDYFLYVFPEEESAYSFSSLVKNYGTQLIGFVPGSGLSNDARSFIEALGTLVQKIGTLGGKKSELQRALEARKVVVLLTGRKLDGKSPIATHKHTHRISTLANEIVDAMQ